MPRCAAGCGAGPTPSGGSAGQPDHARARRRLDVHRRAQRVAAAVTASAGDGWRRRPLRLPRRSLGPSRPDEPVPRRDHVRLRPRRPAAIDEVRAIHRRVAGLAPDGRPYAASDPHLLAWVHVAEVDSFLGAYQRYGAVAPDAGGVRRVRRRDRPGRRRARRRRCAVDGRRAGREAGSYGPSCAGAAEARAAARFLVLEPPLPAAPAPRLPADRRPAIGAAPALGRWPLRLPSLPLAEATLGRASRDAVSRDVRSGLPARRALTCARASVELARAASCSRRSGLAFTVVARRCRRDAAEHHHRHDLVQLSHIAARHSR